MNAATPEPFAVVAEARFTGSGEAEVVRRALSAASPAHWEETLRRAAAGPGGEGWPALALDGIGRDAGEKVVVLTEGAAADATWFVGDLHGDLVALEAALFLVAEEDGGEAGTHIVFLGDLVDDGPHGLEVFLRIVEEALGRPGRVTLLAGNHDEAVRLSEGRFSSSVEPSDLVSWLGERVDDPVAQEAAALFVRAVESAPRAVFWPDGLFAAHGGIPHTDLQPAISSKADLESAECLQDFVWTRAHARARRKIPNRVSRGCQFGVDDFQRFCQVASSALGRPVNRMVRGHDHADDRYDLHPAYAPARLLTLNSMSHRLGRESGGPYVRTPCVARVRTGGPVEVFRLVLSEAAVTGLYPEPTG